MPEPAARKKLIDFAQQGGALLVSQSWKGEGGTPTGAAHPGWISENSEKASLPCARTIRMLTWWRGISTSCSAGSTIYPASSTFRRSSPCTPLAPGGESALLQITNFARASRFFDDSRATVWFPQQYRAARMWTLGSEAPVALTLVPENTGIDVQVPSVSPYPAVEVSLQKLA